LNDLRRQTGTSIIMITHDMGAVAEMSERMIVMYAGRGAEIGGVDEIIEKPLHPYTQGLIACVPHILATVSAERERLLEVPGIVPSLREFGKDQCLFASRCPVGTDICLQKRPPIETDPSGHSVACWHGKDAS
jgi:oligopeptide/dipeptide ABC transporter ATP-binding protein